MIETELNIQVYIEILLWILQPKNYLTKTEKEDGDYVFYVEETNEFVVVSTDGFIRTYFLPSGGKSYFDRQ